MKEFHSLLIQTGLFDGLTDAEVEQVVLSVDYIQLPTNWKIITQGEIGTEFFLVVTGSLQVFTTKPDGTEITLARLERGSYVGEQALIPGSAKVRNASVRTTEPSSLLRIDKKYFEQALARDAGLVRRLELLGEKQVSDNLKKQSALFQTFHLGDASAWRREVHFSSQEVIFNEGDLGDYYYLILDGKVSVYQSYGTGQRLLAQLEAGQGFGELALLKNVERQATVIAEGDVHLLQVDGDVFRELYQKEPELRGYFQTLQKIYPLRGEGIVTQHLGKFLDQDCVTMVFHLDEGRSVICSQMIGGDIVSIQIAGISEDPEWVQLHYIQQLMHTDRLVVLNNNIPIRVVSKGLWVELGKIHTMLLHQVPFTAEEIQRFQKTGNFFHDDQKIHAAEEDIICECLQLDYGTILNAFQNGYHTVEAVAELTGCTTVCGSCKSQVREMIGEGGWTPVMVTEEFEIVPGIRSYRFSPYGPPFKLARPGQHIVIKAAIDGAWVLRPYTITSAADEITSREVTIKREPHGYFSNWIFSQRTPETVLQISDPQGDYYVDLATSDSIICLVAGIGITPAIAILRTMLVEQKTQKLHIDYSASNDQEFIYQDYLQNVHDQHENIQILFRNTESDGRITAADVKHLVDQYPDARIYICGPKAFQAAVEQYLHTADFPEERIHIEEFTAVGGLLQKMTFWEWISERSYFLIGLSLLSLFGFQEYYQIKWPWLESMQAIESVKRWTGFFLTLFILMEWYLPLLRWRRRLKAAASQYHWHKLLGAFSPLIYYVHSTSFGFAFLFMLSSVYFANFVLGLFNQELINGSPFKKKYGYYWLLVHILLSVSMISLILYHVYIAFTYQ